MYSPSTEYNNAVAKREQSPIYFFRIDGLSYDYSTGPVKSASVEKRILLDIPEGGASTLDLVDGIRTAQDIELTLLDIGGQITTLVCTEAVGAPLSTLVNRKAELYAGDVDLNEDKYAVIRTGRITGVRKTSGLNGYVFTLTDVSYLLDGQIMTGASDDTPAYVIANPVNLVWAILTGTFDTTHATFPIIEKSAGAGSFSAPTGLGIPTSLIDEARLVYERDLWHPDTIVRAGFPQVEKSARRWLEAEIFRALQCFPTVSGAGKIGLKFHVPALGVGTTLEVRDTTNLVKVESWRRRFDLHLNRFRYRGDLHNYLYTGSTPPTNEYESSLYELDSPEDTSDRSSTGETITFEVNSGLLRSAYNGASVAAEIMGRMRGRFLKTPVEIKVLVNYTARRLEEGDVIALTVPDLPNITTGSAGVEGRLMTIAGIEPLFGDGQLRLTLLDTNTRRYGLISPGGKVYATASAADRERYAFVAPLSDGSQPYRWI